MVRNPRCAELSMARTCNAQTCSNTIVEIRPHGERSGDRSVVKRDACAVGGHSARQIERGDFDRLVEQMQNKQNKKLLSG